MKKTLALLLALIMLFSFAACGGKQPANNTDNNAAVPENTANAENNTNNTDGYRWIIAEIGENTCGIVGQVNPNTISLTNPETGHNLKINPTVREADMVNLFMNYQYYDVAVPVDLMEEWNEYVTTMPETKYQETVCSIEADMGNAINIANGISGYTYTLSN